MCTKCKREWCHKIWNLKTMVRGKIQTQHTMKLDRHSETCTRLLPTEVLLRLSDMTPRFL